MAPGPISSSWTFATRRRASPLPRSNPRSRASRSPASPNAHSRRLSAPTRALAESTVRAAGSLAELVLVDAPVLADERALALGTLAERVLVLSYDDPLSLATLDASDVPSDAWVIASQARAARIGERAA